MRVIVTLGLWTPWQPEGTLSAARVADQRVEIASAQEAMVQLLRYAGIPFTVTLRPTTVPQIGLDLPTLGTLARVAAAFADLRTWDNRPGGLVVAVAEDALGGSMVPISVADEEPAHYAYDPVVGAWGTDGAAMVPISGADEEPAHYPYDPVVGDWGPGGGVADVELVVTATIPPAIDTTALQTTAAGTLPELIPAAGLSDPTTWGWGTWLLIGGAAWLFLRGR